MSVTENSQVDQDLEIALLVSQIADDYRGKDTVLLDMRTITPIVDFFVVTTAGSQRQMKAMCEEVTRVLKQRGFKRFGAEQAEGDNIWVLQDFGDIVLHVFTPEGRELYDLEGLWADAKRVELPFAAASGDSAVTGSNDVPAE